MSHSRYYNNQFEDYSVSASRNVIDLDNKTIHNAFKTQLTSETDKLMKILEENESNWLRSDYSVYTGLAGIAYTFYKYGKYYNKSEYNEITRNLLERCVAKFKHQERVAFLTGLAGPLALAAVVSHSRHKEEESIHFISKLKHLSAHVLKKHSDIPNELLYGRAGYLSTLLFVNANISPSPIDHTIIEEVVTSIIDHGIAYARSNHSQSPLMYAWHGTEYIGGAHGLAGILYLLLQARQYLTEKQIHSYVKPSLHYLQGLQFPSGNFPSSTGKETDLLVHWCHGAPGVLSLFCLAHKVFEDKAFLDTAIRCGEVIWKKGLLKKGYSICHGVAGNGYALLHLFQQTEDIRYLYQACKFAEWCFHYGTSQNRTPDSPFSLFEGLSGVICFLIDMQQPYSAKFPTYDI